MVVNRPCGSRSAMCTPCACGTMWSESPCHQCTGTCDVGRLEAPVTGEQDDVGEHRPEVRAGPVEQVVEEHRPELRTRQQLLVTARLDRGVGVEEGPRERADQPDGAGEHEPERQPRHGQHRCGVRRERHQAAGDGVGSLGRRHSPEHADPVDAIRHRRARGEGVGTAAGEADDAQRVDVEDVAQLGEVAGPVEDVAVEVRGRGADARAVDADDAQVVAPRRTRRASTGIWRRAPGVPCIHTMAAPRGLPNSAKESRRPSADGHRTLEPRAIELIHVGGFSHAVAAGAQATVRHPDRRGVDDVARVAHRTEEGAVGRDRGPVDHGRQQAGDVVASAGRQRGVDEVLHRRVVGVLVRGSARCRARGTRSVSPSLASSTRSPGTEVELGRRRPARPGHRSRCG